MKKVLHFTSSWSVPCQGIKPIFNELEETYKDIEFHSIDVDSNKALVEFFDISSLPTFVFLHETSKFIGADKEQLVSSLEALKRL